MTSQNPYYYPRGAIVTRSREQAADYARAVRQILTDGSVVWNVELIDRDTVIATIGVIGGERNARRMAAQIDRYSAWIQEGRS